MKRFLLFLFALLGVFVAPAQLVSGPMLGPVELRDAVIWLEVGPATRSVHLVCTPQGGGAPVRLDQKIEATGTYTPIRFVVPDLEPATTYKYSLLLDEKLAPGGTFTTKTLWQWRQPAPDFTFLTGSCAYFNEPKYDRPGTPYGGDSSIFKTMAKEKASFMLWLGDNWYYREVDFYSAPGLRYRARHDRAQPVLQPFLKAMPHYAIWDDHDFGPNDADKSYVLKDESRRIFLDYWPNASAGENGQGIYTKMSYGDVDIFMMDDRWFRSANDMDATVGRVPNPGKRMWGPQQLEWLKSALLSSTATFRIIATGNQTLNPMSRAECLQDYPVEFNELQNFLAAEKIPGLLFLTGDRHHSEVIRYTREGGYPIYDITNSPLTSGLSKVTGTPEAANEARVAGTLVEAQNYTRITVSGAKGARRLQAQFVGVSGAVLGTWTVSETELKYAR
ncbi:alkaline phosphatase D family protein [Flaviaesturariibacter aridisoli]|uniref:Alkaline phosphatase family protein n=1 Tax=Flaviaesturariibacter aridisoli TaxID=2545761 RepID=A0A4R4E7I3_9BACT|nr:alkaline phosphatase D family protein [Flaviaesturariibacter aridisoli]TCZ74873.1 alkaline phosphatase family protein [Flaviaesturariibacter aridisoli]